MGQIATFIDQLHLSYNEVFCIIPYRNLVLMQMDKLREVYGETLEEVEEDTFFATKKILQ